MSDVKRRLAMLEKRSKVRDAPSIVLVFADGATADGEDISLAEFERRFSGDNEPSVIVAVGGIGIDDI